jgi:hypothetical protein
MKRNLKISSISAKRSAKTIHRHTIFWPCLKLSGKWLAQLGFAIGAQVQISVQEDSLIISKGGQK